MQWMSWETEQVSSTGEFPTIYHQTNDLAILGNFGLFGSLVRVIKSYGGLKFVEWPWSTRKVPCVALTVLILLIFLFFFGELSLSSPDSPVMINLLWLQACNITRSRKTWVILNFKEKTYKTQYPMCIIGTPLRPFTQSSALFWVFHSSQNVDSYPWYFKGEPVTRPTFFGQAPQRSRLNSMGVLSGTVNVLWTENNLEQSYYLQNMPAPCPDKSSSG